MAQLEHQHMVIMGKPRNRPGQKGLVSTMSEINELKAKSAERFKAAASLALGAWQRAKPDWIFVLREVPNSRHFATHGEYYAAVNALYD